MVVFDSRVSTRARTVTDDLCGVPGAPRCHQTPRFEVRELGEIDMVSMALATLDLVVHDDARPAFQDGDGTRLPLFLVHPDSGQAGPYCRLAHALGEEFAVSGLQAGGLYSGAEPRRTVPAMAGAYAGAVRAVRPAGLYLLGGGASGAAVACEMAARLDDVRLVAAIGTGLLEPPDTGTESWWDEPRRQPAAWPARCASCSADQ